MPPTQTLCSRTKKVKLPDQKIESCKIVSAFFFIFMSHVKNQLPTQNLENNSKNHLKYFLKHHRIK